MDIPVILSVKFSDSEWTLDGDDYEGLNWISDTPKPTKKELENLWLEVKEEKQRQANLKIDAKTSAIAKLQALGLTIQEVEAAFGLSETDA
jgi:hypothetical protein